eukprot:3299903-Ditylum_brightwellii.AAC.1
MKGSLVNKWRSAQAAYFESIQSKRSSLRVISTLIQKFWDVSWDMWEQRNHAMRVGGKADHHQLLSKLHT